MDPDRCTSLLWLRLRLPLGPCLGHGLALMHAYPSTHSTLRGHAQLRGSGFESHLGRNYHR